MNKLKQYTYNNLLVIFRSSAENRFFLHEYLNLKLMTEPISEFSSNTSLRIVIWVSRVQNVYFIMREEIVGRGPTTYREKETVLVNYYESNKY